MHHETLIACESSEDEWISVHMGRCPRKTENELAHAPGATVLQFEVHQAKSPAEKQTACTLYAERKDAQRTGPATNNPSVDIITARIVPELQLIKK